MLALLTIVKMLALLQEQYERYNKAVRQPK
jgi:hypothetical protein